MSRAADRPPGEGGGDSRLSLALTLADEAGRLAIAGQPDAVARWKGPGDRVTAVDLQIQAHITAALSQRFPQDGVVAEEALVRLAADREFTWIVDPLDGTNNYVLGIPCFAISVGLLRRGEPYAGVVHEPNTGFRCWTLRGHGAFVGARRLALAPRALDAASNIAVRVPVAADLEPLVSRWLREHKFRGFGSVALHLAFAALGAVGSGPGPQGHPLGPGRGGSRAPRGRRLHHDAGGSPALSLRRAGVSRRSGPLPGRQSARACRRGRILPGARPGRRIARVVGDRS